jgi:hypothetical protein
MAIAMIKQNSATTKSQQTTTNLQQPSSGIQNLYLFQRVLKVPPGTTRLLEKNYLLLNFGYIQD